jgi:microcystin-dependent protein
MWSGSVENLPNGFALCDGSIQGEFGVVPDLRGRFIVGYDSRTANSPETAPGVGVKNYAKLKNTGGLTSVTLGATQMPTHTHRLVANAGVSDANSNLMDHRPDGTIGKARETAGNLSYRLVSLDITPTIKPTLGLSSETGGSQAHENRPDYYVLAFIIKIV